MLLTVDDFRASGTNPKVWTEEQQQQIATEADLLRRTLLDLLLENEALRTALKVNQPPALKLELPQSQPVQMPTMGIPAKFTPEQRRLAVERYRQKRKRRLQQPNPNGARYVKMKAVADGKQRNACGKFVKKSEMVQEMPTVPTAPTTQILMQ